MSAIIEEQLRCREHNSLPFTASSQAPATNQQQQQLLEVAFSVAVPVVGVSGNGARPLAHYATLSDSVTFFGHALHMQVKQQLERRTATLPQAADIEFSPAVPNHQLPIALIGDTASSHSGSSRANVRPSSSGKQMNEVSYS